MSQILIHFHGEAGEPMSTTHQDFTSQSSVSYGDATHSFVQLFTASDIATSHEIEIRPPTREVLCNSCFYQILQFAALSCERVLIRAGNVIAKDVHQTKPPINQISFTIAALSILVA